MNPLFSRSYSFLLWTNALAFLCWNIRTYLINWYILENTNSTFLVGFYSFGSFGSCLTRVRMTCGLQQV